MGIAVGRLGSISLLPSVLQHWQASVLPAHGMSDPTTSMESFLLTFCTALCPGKLRITESGDFHVLASSRVVTASPFACLCHVRTSDCDFARCCICG